MREALDQWDYVLAAYAVGIVGTLVMVAWAWMDMKRAEKRREESRRK